MQTSKKDLFSDQSFCSTAVTSCFLFMLLLKETSRQTGHLPISCFNSILNLTPMLIYDTEKNKNLILQKKTAARQGQTETGVVFCTSAHSFCFSKEGGAMWPCSHLITPVGASSGHIPVAVPTWPPSLFCLVIPQTHWGMGEHLSSTQQTRAPGLVWVSKGSGSISKEQTAATTKKTQSQLKLHKKL